MHSGLLLAVVMKVVRLLMLGKFMFGRVPGDRRREILAVHPEQSVVGRWSSITTMKMMVLSSGEEPRARKEFKLHTQSEEKNWIRCQQRLPSFFYETLSCLPQADTTLTERSLSPFSSIRNTTGLKEKPNTTQKEIRPTSIFLLLLLPQCPTPSWHANVNKEIVVAVVAAVSFSFSYLPGGLPSSRTILERRVFVFFLKITAAAIQMHPSRRNRREPQRTSTGGGGGRGTKERSQEREANYSLGAIVYSCREENFPPQISRSSPPQTGSSRIQPTTVACRATNGKVSKLVLSTVSFT